MTHTLKSRDQCLVIPGNRVLCTYIHGWLWFSGGHRTVSWCFTSTPRSVLIDFYHFDFKVPDVEGEVNLQYVQKFATNGYVIRIY
jgi:hypothetical protein